MRCVTALLGLVAGLATLAAAGQQNELPFGDLLALASEQMGMDCERMLEPRHHSSQWAAREAEMRAAVFCDCMPPALAALGRARDPQALVTGEEFSALVMREFDICGARAVRDTAERDCDELAPAGAPATYCACFVTAINNLTDEQIVSDSIAARDNLEERQDARRDGTREPPLEPGLLARIDNECRLPARAR